MTFTTTTVGRVTLALAMLFALPIAAWAAIVVDTNVFVGGEEGPQGTANYRIPGFAVAPDGSLLAFAEGRRSNADPGQAGFPIDLVMKRSTDGGRTWSPLVVLQADVDFDFDDPTPVVDQVTGTVHLIHASTPDDAGLFQVPAGTGLDSMSIFQISSTDNGQTWSQPLNITTQVKDPAWRGIVPGPGSGIQLRWQTDPARNGRLVIPGSVNATDNFVWFSDDHGSTWQSGDLAAGPDGNENEVVELTNGDLMMNARQNGGSVRRTYRSTDGGQTWQPQVPGDINMTTVDASLIRYSAERDGDDRDRLLFAAPLGPGRTNMAVWTSYDEGQSFINPVQLAEGHAAYSVLQRLANGNIGLVYEATGNTRIRYLGFDLLELEKADHSRDMSHFDGFGNTVDGFRGGVGWSGSWTSVSGVSVIENGGLEFNQFQIEGPRRHAQIVSGQMERALATPIDLSDEGDHYISIFIRSDSDSSDASASEFLDIDLRSGGTPLFTFGVTSSESLIVQNSTGASAVTSGPDAIVIDTSYLLLVKIAAQSQAAGNFDQIFLASYDDFSAVPDDETQINWQLVGSTGDNFDQIVDSLTITGGGRAIWNVDELRIGSTFDSVIADNGLTGVPGDVNQDGMVDHLDVEQLVEHWLATGLSGITQRVTSGDLTLDGRVNLADVFILHQALIQETGEGFPFALLAGDTVPEPAGCIVAVSAVAVFLLVQRMSNPPTTE